MNHDVWVVLMRADSGGDSVIQNIVCLYYSAGNAVNQLKEIAKGNNLRILECGLKTTKLPGNVYFYEVERWEVF